MVFVESEGRFARVSFLETTYKAVISMLQTAEGGGRGEKMLTIQEQTTKVAHKVQSSDLTCSPTRKKKS